MPHKHSHSPSKDTRNHHNRHITKPEEQPRLYEQTEDPSEPPEYDHSKDRGRRIKLRQEEQCVFNHSRAENSPLLDVKQWRHKLKILRALPKPSDKESTVKRPRHRPHKGKKPKDKKSDLDQERSTKISTNAPPSTPIKIPSPDDPDLLVFGDILDPQITADTRYDKYLVELRGGGTDTTDLESLYKNNVEHVEKPPENGNVLNAVGKTDDLHTNEEDINIAELIAKAPTKKQVPVRSFSTEPNILVSGTLGTLHEKPNTDSRMSLNNFKLRLNLSDKDAKEVENDKNTTEAIDSVRQAQSVLDSARAVSEDVKLVNFITKPLFSPRRMSLHNSGPINQKTDAALRRDSLHLPTSTTQNVKTKTPLPSTNTVGTEVKGGGWKVAHSKREIDFGRMIPVSVTEGVTGKAISTELWKFKT